jgi:tRNA(Ile)-lysidine synthase
MASTRKARPPTADPLERSLRAALQEAVDRVLGGDAAGAGTEQRGQGTLVRRRKRAGPDAPLLVAYSGGPDSTALLELACALRDAREPGFGQVQALHVHHGLHKQADDWAEFCQRQCDARRVPLAVARVQVERHGRGVEAAAREARYRELARGASDIGAVAVLTGHHLDDRLETFLLQWLRGAGPDGLCAMSERRLLQPDSPLVLLRPLLRFTRERIAEFLQRRSLDYIVDPSNSDARLDRNALRLRVMPEFARMRSGFRAAAERSMDLIAESADVLQTVASEDLRTCALGAPAGMLRIDRLAGLPESRRMLAVRQWLAQAGLPPPPRARLREALQQALHAGADARLLVRLGDRELRRHRGLLCLHVPARQELALHAIHWQGEPELAVPGWGGTLVFTRTQGEGFDAQWLASEPLELRPRTGGERFKPHPTRPSKRLKQVFQDARIPEFERGALPLLWRDGRLIYVAGVGPDVRLLVDEGERVRIEWIGAARLLQD